MKLNTYKDNVTKIFFTAAFLIIPLFLTGKVNALAICAPGECCVGCASNPTLDYESGDHYACVHWNGGGCPSSVCYDCQAKGGSWVWDEGAGYSRCTADGGICYAACALCTGNGGGGGGGSNPKGWHDGSSCAQSSGWTCDPDDYNTPLTVKFYKDSISDANLIGSTLANSPREQAVANECGGNANHGFVFATPNGYGLQDGNAHNIYAVAQNIGGGGNFNLSGTPKSITCASCEVRGYKNIMPGDLRIDPARFQPVTKDGANPVTTNPYYFFNVTGTHTFAVPNIVGYKTEYTLCYNRTDCHSLGDPSTTLSNAVTINTDVKCPAGYADLWWHYTLCGAAPAVPAPIGCTYSGNTMRFSWSGITNWGSTCGTASNTYSAYADKTINPPITVRCKQIPWDQNTWCEVSANPGDTYHWRVNASNGEYTSWSGTFDCKYPSTVKDWFTSLDGDVYAPGISVTIPTTTWSPKTIGYDSSTVFNSNLAKDTEVVNGNLPDKSPTESDTYVNRMPIKGQSSMWVPYKNTFDTPADTEAVTDFSTMDLDPANVYTFTGNITTDTTYDLTGPGVAVVYLIGDASPTFDIKGDFISSSADERIVFVTNKPVKIWPSVYTAIPSESSDANIQAAIITSNSITLDPASDNPSIVLEGPFAALNSLVFNRKPLTTHTFPSEVVKYNSTILNGLTSQERGSSTANYTGLMTSEIIWEGDL